MNTPIPSFASGRVGSSDSRTSTLGWFVLGFSSAFIALGCGGGKDGTGGTGGMAASTTVGSGGAGVTSSTVSVTSSSTGPAPTCTDGKLNGAETDIDCGGGTCLPCAENKNCATKTDCVSGICSDAHQCVAPSCSDTMKDGDETDEDCGGSCAQKCADTQGCLANTDCSSAYCNASMTCATPSCSDGAQNQNETGVDCGGSCGPCANNQGCAGGGDCLSGFCSADVCKAWATTVSVGSGHACALTPAGGVKCWGINTYGQLGNNSTTQSLVPVDVQGLTSGVASISVGGATACAVTTGGGAKCWGYNNLGQVGNNSTTNSLVAVDVSGLTSGVAAISTGTQDTCALTTGGGVKCWGDNGNGELGNGSTTTSHVPVDVTGLTSGAIALSTGYEGACVLRTGGGAQCWGLNLDGELGNNMVGTSSKVPVNVTGLSSGAVQLSASIARCAITSSGGLRCWGDNFSGGVGNGTTTDQYSAVDVALSGNAANISMGGSPCAVTTSGAVECWGYNGKGNLGNGTTTNSLVPVPNMLTSGIATVSSGVGDSACAVTTSGKVLCWGANANGALGNGSTTPSLVPVPVTEN